MRNQVASVSSPSSLIPLLLCGRIDEISGELRQTHTDVTEGCPQVAVCGKGAGDQLPKRRRMIELTKMAELMNNDVVGEVGWEKRDFVVETQVAFAGATSPPRLLAPNGDTVPSEAIVPVEIREPFARERERALFVFCEMPLTSDELAPSLSRGKSPEMGNGIQHPFRFLSDKLLNGACADERRSRDGKNASACNREPNATRAFADAKRVLHSLRVQLNYLLHTRPFYHQNPPKNGLTYFAKNEKLFNLCPETPMKNQLEDCPEEPIDPFTPHPCPNGEEKCPRRAGTDLPLAMW